MNHYGLSTEDFIRYALDEDTGDGDHTSLSTIEADSFSTARVMAKEDGIIAGIDVAIEVLKKVDPLIGYDTFQKDGARVQKGNPILNVKGNTRSLLKAERLLLNCMQRMSGIATLTRAFVDAIEGTGAIVLDTRKTTPNFRQFEKLAVRLGGGQNHRTGLYDMILIKDNHVDAAGGIKPAIEKANVYLNKTGKNLKIEIETRNLTEVMEVMSIGKVNRIMFDNFTPQFMKEAVEMIDGRFETEASGGINLETIRSFAETGVNYISVGALTHSYRSLDISMKIQK
ncbi:MAG: carboxylating nicotinate-nucleotide diphosphorylase [Bacteroidia bacterium]